MFNNTVNFIRKTFKEPEKFIALHEPLFVGNEREYVLDAIDSTYVSSVGKYVDRFEQMMCDFTGSKYAVATVNGTAALHMSLLLADVKRNDLVITQPLSFIATCNAISYIGANPIFIDIDRTTLSLNPYQLLDFLQHKTEQRSGNCIHIESGKRIKACVPMHTFGHVGDVEKMVEICGNYNIVLVEDAAESIGSKYKGKHSGTFGLLGAFSFNGNKTITCGGGGAIITNSEQLRKLGKHLTTQAKVPHPWDFVHDSIGYNYRLPNLNAALACAQMERLDEFVNAKRRLADEYAAYFKTSPIRFFSEPQNSFSNYWLNAVLLDDKVERDSFLKYMNDRSIMTRPTWALMNTLAMFRNDICEDIPDAEWISDRLVNIPSSVILN